MRVSSASAGERRHSRFARLELGLLAPYLLLALRDALLALGQLHLRRSHPLASFVDPISRALTRLAWSRRRLLPTGRFDACFGILMSPSCGGDPQPAYKRLLALTEAGFLAASSVERSPTSSQTAATRGVLESSAAR
jgi:hypothetical protein